MQREEGLSRTYCKVNSSCEIDNLLVANFSFLININIFVT